MKVAKRVALKNPHKKKKSVAVWQWTYCGDHFAIYSNIESLCSTPETNTVLYVNYTSIEKKFQITEELVLLPKSQVYYKLFLGI